MQQAEQHSILKLPDTLQTLKLTDGRDISISMCGDPTGRPVLFLHPIQGNRFMPLTMHKAAVSLGLRIIALDRPGIGASSPLPNRTVQQYPADIAEICKQLDISQFSVFASSAGTMYALALTVAAETKDMVVGKVTLVAPWIPSSSRAPGFGGWLSLLGSWTPVSLLHIAVGFSNRRIAQQAKRRKQFRCAVKHNASRFAAWGRWLTGSAADLACAGIDSLKHTVHFVINDYISRFRSNSKSCSLAQPNPSKHIDAAEGAAAADTDRLHGSSSCSSSSSSTTATDGHIVYAYSKAHNNLKPTTAACSLVCSTALNGTTHIRVCCRTHSLNSMTSDTFAISTTDNAYTSTDTKSFITMCQPTFSHSSSSNNDLSSLSDSSCASDMDGATADHKSCNSAHAREKPVTELMTRSNQEERAAFAADPSNDAIYKAMIEQWGPSLSGIIQEMQLCTERSHKLHFNYIQDVTAPVRVYMGTADQVLLHSHVQHWADNASNVELVTIDGGTHDGLMHTHKVMALQALAQDLGSLN